MYSTDFVKRKHLESAVKDTKNYFLLTSRQKPYFHANSVRLDYYKYFFMQQNIEIIKQSAREHSYQTTFFVRQYIVIFGTVVGNQHIRTKIAICSDPFYMSTY